jgi:DNA-binding MarR family transcriptional regulator
MASAVLDAVIVAAAGLGLRRLRGRPWHDAPFGAQWDSLAVSGCYFVAGMAVTGRTAGQAVLGLRMVDEVTHGRPGGQYRARPTQVLAARRTAKEKGLWRRGDQMATSRERAQWEPDPGGVSLASINAMSGAAGAVDHDAEVVTAENVDWLVAHLRAVVVATPAVWAGRGMTLLQLTALHLISALAPVTLTDLAKALGTRPPATSAMVARLTHAGLVRRTSDSHNRRRVQLTLTAVAEPMIGDTDPDTARRLQAVLNGMSPRARCHVIDMLVNTIRRSAN